jgi:hypothetical protein
MAPYLMIILTTSTYTLAFMMKTPYATAVQGNTLKTTMTLQQAQHLTSLLKEDGYHAWPVDGCHVNLMVGGVVYEIKKAKQQPNAK